MRGAINSHTYIGLDIVRFTAALSVALYHLGYWWWLPAQGRPSGPMFGAAFAPIVNAARWGYVGVPVFFVLSGFIIATSAIGLTSAEFLRARALRLFPAAWICAPITLAVIWHEPDLLARTLRSLLLSPMGPWLNGLYWTLGVEIVFYLIIAAALKLGISLWRAGATLGLTGAVFWIARAVDFATGGRWQYLFDAIGHSLAGVLLITQACYFGVGISLWAIHRNGLSWPKAALLALLVLAGCVALFAGARIENGQQGGSPTHAREAPLLWLAATVLIAASIQLQPAIWRRFGRWGATVRTLGLTTYPLYLVHSDLGSAIMERSHLPPGPALALAIGSVMLIAYVVVKLEPIPRSVLRKAIGGRGFTTAAADLP